MLEFYAFLNVWGVENNELDDQVEKFYYKHDKAVEHSEDLFERVQKVLFILGNVEEHLTGNQIDQEFLY